MNILLHKFATHKITSEFLYAFVGEDIIYELIGSYIHLDKPLEGIIYNDSESSEFDPIMSLTDYLQDIGRAELIEISDNDDGTVFIYRYDDTTVAFAVSDNYTVAVWNS